MHWNKDKKELVRSGLVWVVGEMKQQLEHGEVGVLGFLLACQEELNASGSVCTVSGLFGTLQ